MRLLTKAALTGIWVVLSAGLLTKLWIARPEMLPQIPPEMAERLVRAYGATDAESVSNLELLLGLGVFVPTTALATCLIFALVRAVRKNLRKRTAGTTQRSLSD